MRLVEVVELGWGVQGEHQGWMASGPMTVVQFGMLPVFGMGHCQLAKLDIRAQDLNVDSERSDYD